MKPLYLDTSALAKRYLNESLSDEVDDFLATERPIHISSLTGVELRCLLARRRRAGEISAENELSVFSVFEQDLVDGHLTLDSIHEDHFADAVRLISSLPDQSLRTLDALHLAVARREGLTRLVTADRVMAKAGEALDLEVKLFAD